MFRWRAEVPGWQVGAKRVCLPRGAAADVVPEREGGDRQPRSRARVGEMVYAPGVTQASPCETIPIRMGWGLRLASSSGVCWINRPDS